MKLMECKNVGASAQHYYYLLNEATKTKTKTNVLSQEEFDRLFRRAQQELVSSGTADLQKTKGSTVPAINTVSKSKTANALQQYASQNQLTSQQQQQLSSFMADLEQRLGGVDAEQGYSEPTQTTTLPDVVTDTNTLATLGQKYDVDFHEVRNLPGMVRQAVRMLGRELFKTFTTTPVDDVSVVSTFTNAARDVNNVAGYAVNHSEHGKKLNIDFSNIMPGYDADAYLADVNGQTFLVVQDMAGQYVYTWPSATNKNIEWDRNWNKRKLELTSR